jgi:uridine kinase
MTETQRPVTIGVAGGTGSGKTTVSNALLSRIGEHHIAYLPHDTYYKDIDQIPLHEGSIRNFDHPDALDTHWLIANVKELQQWQSTEIPVYDFRNHRRLPYTQTVGPQPIILVEGILIFAEPELRELLDVKIFVDTDSDVRFIRRLQRDITERARTVDSVIEQYLNTVRPMHLQLVEPSKRYADIIIPEGGFNAVAIDMLADRIRNMLPPPQS